MKENQFSQWMKGKSDDELLEISKSEKYVDEARAAADFEINERKHGPVVKVEDEKARELGLVKEFIEGENTKENKQHRAAALFTFGAMCIGISGYFLFFVDDKSGGWLPLLILLLVGVASVLVVSNWRKREKDR